MSDMHIKDSGQRTEFGTGAVRDMHSGKGRFDLLPWHAIHDLAKHCEEGAIKYGERNVDKGIPLQSFVDSTFRHLKRFWCGDTDEPHLRAAAWNIMWALNQETTHPELNVIPENIAAYEAHWSEHKEDTEDDVNETYIKGYKAGANDMMRRIAGLLDVKVFENNGEMTAVCVKKERA